MLISEMYIIEKIIHSYRMNGITDVKELINLRHCHNLSSTGSIYYYRAAIIPYSEMLELINEYNNTDMEETTEMFWWDRLTEKYDKYDGEPIMFTVNDTIYRFKDVDRLSKSLIYGKKMEKLYERDSHKEITSNGKHLVRKKLKR